ncbi:MAG TPA: SDR family oxidoreductase [Gemmatimonadaceae bacterium]|nr:SDR family oxidoreductase [Gemmatimonadaceae bacterium]
MSFTNSTVLITGVGRAGQVGEAVARAFGEQGAALLLVSRDAAEATARAEALSAGGVRATAYECDLTDPPAVAELADRVRRAHGGRLQALVNVAGGFAMSGPVANSDLAVWQRMLANNLTTAYIASRAFLPMVRAARGAIVFFASEAALPGARLAEMSAYAAAKSAVVILMQTIAQEERRNGVRSNAVAPSTIRTLDNERAMGSDARYVERADVASAVVYLCSDDARAVTGQVLRLS